MKKNRNTLYCTLAFLLLIVVLCAVLGLAAAAVWLYIDWCNNSQSAGMGGWILTATWLLLPALILCFTLFTKSIRFWKSKVIHNGKWCIDHEWEGRACRRCGTQREEDRRQNS